MRPAAIGNFMDTNPFSPTPPDWAEKAAHAVPLCCPTCRASPKEAKAVWLNRRAPVFIEGFTRRKWQEFYHCECGTAWWGWSNERETPEWLIERNARRDAAGNN